MQHPPKEGKQKERHLFTFWNICVLFLFGPCATVLLEGQRKYRQMSRHLSLNNVFFHATVMSSSPDTTSSKSRLQHRDGQEG